MRLARNAFSIVGALLVLITLTPVVKWGAELLSDNWDREDAEVLVVLGGSMLTPGTGPEATPGYETYLRCVMAAALAHNFGFKYVVVTGSDGLAETMRQVLMSRGIEPNRILTENAARTTRENALFTRRILARLCPRMPRVVVLTSEYHSRRARLTFQNVGFIASSVPAPDVIKRSSTMSYRPEGFVTLAVEVIKFAAYKWKGYA